MFIILHFNPGPLQVTFESLEGIGPFLNKSTSLHIKQHTGFDICIASYVLNCRFILTLI